MDPGLPPRSFYCLADGRYFLGAVAMINSLRLAGHTERIVLLDCGLEERQRDMLRREAEILPADHSSPHVPPFLQKGRAVLSRPATAMVVIDADMIVVRSLDPLFRLAEQGKVAAVADVLSGRFSDQWRSALRLPPVRRQPYVNSGLIALPFDAGTRLMRLVEEALPAVDVGRSFWTHGAEDDPFLFLDQDVINALLASEFPSDLLAVLPSRLAPQPPFEGLSVSAGKPLRLRYPDGEEPFAVHHTMRKPWLDRIPANAYSELLGSLLLDPKLPIRLRPGDVPRRLRAGGLGALDRAAIRLAFGGRWLARSARSRLAGTAAESRRRASSADTGPDLRAGGEA
jgi:hypothetical protein